MLEIVFFYIAATVALIATVMAMTRANAIHALIYLIVSLLAVAVIFFLIGAPFLPSLGDRYLCWRDYGSVRICHHDA